jgi:beta-glucosidase
MNKKLKHLAAIVLLTTLATSAGAQQQSYPYLNPQLPIEQRVNDLISRMTPEEKVSQMMNSAAAIERLGVPAYNWWSEALHGVARAGSATVFPQAIAMAATFDDQAVQQAFDIVSTEARAKYNDFQAKKDHQIYHGLSFWTPNINIFRDPRWGRGQETYGEDPYLTSQMGLAVVRGLQGNDSKYFKSIACAKHYAVHSGPESTRHSFDAEVSPRDLWETYLPAFETLVKEGNVQQVMCAYNRFEGKPCCGSDKLLVNILRNDWGYKSIVVSDCGAINDFYEIDKRTPRHDTHPRRRKCFERCRSERYRCRMWQ